MQSVGETIPRQASPPHTTESDVVVLATTRTRVTRLLRTRPSLLSTNRLQIIRFQVEAKFGWSAPRAQKYFHRFNTESFSQPTSLSLRLLNSELGNPRQARKLMK